jgi:rsbT co-antagonist protein RsbR
MMATDQNHVGALLVDRRAEVIESWLNAQRAASTLRPELMTVAELRGESERLLDELCAAWRTDPAGDTSGPAWASVRAQLEDLSRSRADDGYSPSETATFVFSIKQPVFDVLKSVSSGEELATRFWQAATVIDRLGLITTEAFQNAREEVIRRQQEELIELSTPVIKLWDGAVAVPLIGTLDSARTQVVMENLLQRIVDTDATIAIIDITGVPMVDTLVAQHLLKTVAAARLMGAECIVSGIRPQIAQTIVHLGLDLSDVITKATLADAFVLALERMGQQVVPTQPEE